MITKKTLTSEQFKNLTKELIKIAEDKQEEWDEILFNIPTINKEQFQCIVDNDFDIALNTIYEEQGLNDYTMTSEQLETASEIFKDYTNIFEDWFIEQERENRRRNNAL